MERIMSPWLEAFGQKLDIKENSGATEIILGGTDPEGYAVGTGGQPLMYAITELPKHGRAAVQVDPNFVISSTCSSCRPESG